MRRFWLVLSTAEPTSCVSGNLHLLDLGQYRGISMMNVRQFLERRAAAGA